MDNDAGTRKRSREESADESANKSPARRKISFVEVSVTKIPEDGVTDPPSNPLEPAMAVPAPQPPSKPLETAKVPAAQTGGDPVEAPRKALDIAEVRARRITRQSQKK